MLLLLPHLDRLTDGLWCLDERGLFPILFPIYCSDLSVGYQKFVDPGVSPEFQAAAIRFGITMAPPGVYMRYYCENLK